MNISPLIKEKAPLILAEIKKASSILLHCHPSPDPDSVGSALAMKFALEQLGKKATVIKGDSDIPQAFMHFPGAGEIVMKNYFEIDSTKYDLIIVLDSSNTGVTRLAPFEFPPNMKVINIDHHRTNPGCGIVNLVVSGVSSCAEVLFELFTELDIEISPSIAANIFIGMYTDSGGFKYPGTTPRSFEVASILARSAPDYPELIAKMENSNLPQMLRFQGLALNSIETFLGDRVAIAAVSFEALEAKGLPSSQLGLHNVSTLMRTVIGWEVSAAMIEPEKGKIKISFRSRDADRYDVSLLAAAFGGGGHKAASGAGLEMSLPEAKELVVAKAKELYNL